MTQALSIQADQLVVVTSSNSPAAPLVTFRYKKK
jgi:hypothetical protein